MMQLVYDLRFRILYLFRISNLKISAFSFTEVAYVR
jgi:hypothetical protein